MKLAIDDGRLHLRFYCGTGFALFVISKLIKSKSVDAANTFKPLGKQIKKLLKEYRRVNGALDLVEIEGKDGARITVKI